MNPNVIPSDFLSYTRFQKEASLLIYRTTDELKAFEKKLQEEKFVEALDGPELFHTIKKGEKVYVILNKKNAKEIYDLSAEYPTGQVSFKNVATQKIEWANPNYSISSFFIVADAELLAEFENKNMSLRNVSGLAYQYS